MQHIREKEWISAGDDMGWFNGYYDNHGNAVEYSKKDEVRMMLTGQVFAVMSKTAGEEQVKGIPVQTNFCLIRKPVDIV